MRAIHDGSPAVALILVILLSLASGCSQSGSKAQLEGLSSVDLVGIKRSLAPDGQKDGLITLHLGAGGTVAALTLHSVDGQLSAWDTTPTSGLWVLGVADKEKPNELINKPDGSITINADKPKEMLLYFADNGSVRDGKTHYSVTIAYVDGTKKEVAVTSK
jgi:hypothetical protein